MTTEYEKAMDAQPVAWVAADTLNSPHPVCVSSLAYMSQLDKDRGREYVPLYAAPVAAQGEDDAWCAECGVKLENVRPGKHQHPTCSQAAPIEEAQKDAERLAFLAREPVIEGFVGVKKDIYDYASDCAEENGRDEFNDEDMFNWLRRLIDAAIDHARRTGAWR